MAMNLNLPTLQTASSQELSAFFPLPEELIKRVEAVIKSVTEV